jgi:hypothetical protein
MPETTGDKGFCGVCSSDRGIGFDVLTPGAVKISTIYQLVNGWLVTRKKSQIQTGYYPNSYTIKYLWRITTHE